MVYYRRAEESVHISRTYKLCLQSQFEDIISTSDHSNTLDMGFAKLKNSKKYDNYGSG